MQGVHTDTDLVTFKKTLIWIVSLFVCFLTQAQCFCPRLPERSICLNSWNIRALELLSGQQRQDAPLSLPPVHHHSAKEAFNSHCFVEQRAADHRGNATRPLLSVVFLHGRVGTVTHTHTHTNIAKMAPNIFHLGHFFYFTSDTPRTFPQPCFPLAHSAPSGAGLRTACICFKRPVQRAQKPQPQQTGRPSAAAEGRQNKGGTTNSQIPGRRVDSKQLVCHDTAIQSSATSKASLVFP